MRGTIFQSIFAALKLYYKTQATIKELMAYCEANLLQHLIPADIAFIGALPVNNNGKVDYKKLLSD